MRNEEGKKTKKKEREKKNTWTPFSTGSSQTNEAIKKCETSALHSARQRSTVHKHNGGHRVKGTSAVRRSERIRGHEGNLSLASRAMNRQVEMQAAWDGRRA